MDPSRLASTRGPSGCVSNLRSSSGNMTQGCALRVQKCAVGRSQEVSSSVPARTWSASRVVGSGFGPLQIHVPQSGQTHRVTVRPLLALRWSGRGWVPVRSKAPAVSTSAIEKALASQTLAFRAVAGVDELRNFVDLVTDRAALTASGLGEPHCPTSRIRTLVRRQPFVARHGRPRIVPTTVGFQCVSGVSLASDDGRPREGRGAWRLSARCAFCSPYSPVSEHSALGAVEGLRAPARA